MRPIQSKTKARARRMGEILLCAVLVFVTVTTNVSSFTMAESNDGTLAAASRTLVEMNSEWTFLEDGSDQGTAWRQPEFNDSTWKSGAAPLGYASAGKGQDIATTISYGNDSSNKPITVYFRQTFDLANADAIKQLNGTLIRDDGAVIYLNGIEVYRINLPGGTINHRTPALSAVGDERDPLAFTIEPSLLVEGENVITAEVHQNAGSSSDLYFSLALAASTEELPKNRGLFAQFYTNKGSDTNFAFDEFKANAIYPNINFSNLEPIHQSMTGRSDLVSVRWTGQLTPESTNDYTFYMMGDNGFRLWIDDMDTPLIDFWEDKWDLEQTSSPISLEAGKSYDFKIEYFENNGGSNLYLNWSAPGLNKQIVPERMFTLPANYTGMASGKLLADGKRVELQFLDNIAALPQNLAESFKLEAGGQEIAIEKIVINEHDAASLVATLSEPVESGLELVVSYDGKVDLKLGDNKVESFRQGIVNSSYYISFKPIAIAMSLYGSPKTNRSFAWYTKYDEPSRAPENVMDSIVEIVAADEQFDSEQVLRYTGTSEVLNLRYTSTTNATYIGHKVKAESLTPGTAYKYRLGSENNWSDVGYFTTEAEESGDFQFLHLTDSQGANAHDYEVWANTLKEATTTFADSEFLVMTGDMVDAGALEYQWLDFFGKPQDLLMDLPIQAAVGNHEGPYNDNYYYHFNYPNDSIKNPLPPGSVYSYEYGDALFMIINTMDIGWDARQHESMDQQIEWMRRVVAQTDKKWKFVAFHRAVYSLGNHQDSQESLSLREKMVPVFDELGIDVVLQGHDHTYTRTYQMYGNKAIKDVETDENGNALNPDGTVYVLNNAAGTKFYNIRQVDNFYGAKFEQSNKQVYSGIDLIGDSLTYTSYRVGEDQPFDTYTIVRDDSLPSAVEDAASGLDGEGNTILSWAMPDDDEGIRGFRIYELDGKMNDNFNWSAYIPAKAGQAGYNYKLEGLDPDESYTFIIRAVDKRNNSEEVAVEVDASSTTIAAPTAGHVDDGFNTFGWTNVPGFDRLEDYEFSVDGGEHWATVTANPQPVGDDSYAASAVQVRVKADPASNREAGQSLLSRYPYTKNSIHRVYNVSGTITKGEKLKVEVDVRRVSDDYGSAYVVFQLMNGKQPQLINAIPITKDQISLSQYFNVEDGDYSVKVFVFDNFNGDMSAPVHLAQPLELK